MASVTWRMSLAAMMPACAAVETRRSEWFLASRALDSF
jgi:hypothetical protein